MGARTRIGATLSALAMGALVVGCEPPSPWRGAELVSVDASGADSGNAGAHTAVWSPDGTKLMFTTKADDLGPVDTNGSFDLYLRDLTTGETDLLSVNRAGTDSANSDSSTGVFSPDGTKVVFFSFASDLVTTDTNGLGDVFIRDLETGTTSLVSVNAAGTDSGDSSSEAQHGFSPDGTKVVFTSRSSNLGPPDGNGDNDIFVRDLVAGTTTMVSANLAGTSGGDAYSEFGAFSPDGSEILFQGFASNLVANDGNDAVDVFIRDLATATTALVSVRADGGGSGDGDSLDAAFSPDGSKVRFGSSASNLSPIVPSGQGDVFVRDLAAGTTELVSVDATGTTGGDGPSVPLSFSPDGGRLLFASVASNFGPTDTNSAPDVYLRDLVAGTTKLVSTNGAGTDSGGQPTSTGVFVGDDRVIITTMASDLGLRDTNVDQDLYVRDLVTGGITLLTSRADGTDSANGFSSQPLVSPDGRRVAFTSFGSNLGPADTNALDDVYVATLRGADLSVDGEVASSAGELTYELTVVNDGPDAAEGARVGLLLPEGTTFVPAAGCDGPTPEAPRLVVCPLGTVAEGATVDVTVEATVQAPPGTELEAVAVAASTTFELRSPDNIAHLTTTAGGA